jgi:Protein of unknown function (DUF2934)
MVTAAGMAGNSLETVLCRGRILCVMNAENPPEPELNPMDVAACAYLIWEKEGRPHGRDVEHWMQAETLLRAIRAAEAKAERKPAKNAASANTSAMVANKRKATRAARQEKEGAAEP